MPGCNELAVSKGAEMRFAELLASVATSLSKTLS